MKQKDINNNWYKKAQDEEYEEYEEITEENIPSKNKGGDCYEASAKYLQNKYMEGNHNLILVHGEVTGQGSISGIKYGHAWVEDGEMVIDKSNGRNIELPKIIYYALGNINPQKVYKYNYRDLLKKISEHGHWGPWDLKTEL